MGVAPAGTSAPHEAAAEARLAALAPGYLEQVRTAARRLSLNPSSTSDARAALEAVDEFAIIDLDVPTMSRKPIGRFAKKAVKRLISWYLRYLGAQISALGQSVAHLGTCLLDRTERLEEQAAGLRADVERLKTRIDQMERGGPVG
jgi:hypothetical protein